MFWLLSGAALGVFFCELCYLGAADVLVDLRYLLSFVALSLGRSRKLQGASLLEKVGKRPSAIDAFNNIFSSLFHSPALC